MHPIHFDQTKNTAAALILAVLVLVIGIVGLAWYVTTTQ